MEQERRREEEERGEQERRQAEERGMPGGGRGRTDTPGRSGVYPVSGPHSPDPQARIHGEASWGQGERGAAGYDDHGGSELETYGTEKGLGGATAGPSGEPLGEEPAPAEGEAARRGEELPTGPVEGEFPEKRSDIERQLTRNEPGNVIEGELPASRDAEEQERRAAE